MVKIKEVKTRKDITNFIMFPVRLYKDCKFYVPQFYSDEKNYLPKEIFIKMLPNINSF